MHPHIDCIDGFPLATELAQQVFEANITYLRQNLGEEANSAGAGGTKVRNTHDEDKSQTPPADMTYHDVNEVTEYDLVIDAGTTVPAAYFQGFLVWERNWTPALVESKNRLEKAHDMSNALAIILEELIAQMFIFMLNWSNIKSLATCFSPTHVVSMLKLLDPELKETLGDVGPCLLADLQLNERRIFLELRNGRNLLDLRTRVLAKYAMSKKEDFRASDV
ncbi:hypothetical protein P280DRAFT_520118 [Massarina eburnea CBS 473.64]|uniref:Uncharacterized protein n=1 Tax=Massarina eburnea CBS 473.64 TaxID=1395130 RepID=A0A6A6RTH1_9PLEO|nr:hypothetical protein P280DRAFT_520118 [Massarina eburnea CBS 473.64]